MKTAKVPVVHQLWNENFMVADANGERRIARCILRRFLTYDENEAPRMITVGTEYYCHTDRMWKLNDDEFLRETGMNSSEGDPVVELVTRVKS